MSEKWVDFFVRQEFGKYFARIDDVYLENTFNSYGIAKQLNNPEACYLIRKTKRDFEEYKRRDPNIENEMIKAYGLLHARYILTVHGLESMYKNYIQDGLFPTCPRAFCRNCVCLPYGLSEKFGDSFLKMYCPNCGDVYNIDDELLISHIDGSYFGSSWIHMFLLKYSDVLPISKRKQVYVPRISGFKLYYPNSEEEDNSYDSDSI